MRVDKTKLNGVLLITPEIFRDVRGEFVEIYNKEKYQDAGINIDFVEDDISVSKKNVLRGIHGNNNTWKLISCLKGRVFFVVIDCHKKTFGQWQSFELSDTNRMSILVPPMYGNGYLALTESAIIKYKQSTYYNPKSQFTYSWDDPKFSIPWPIKNPILTERDKSAKHIKTRSK